MSKYRKKPVDFVYDPHDWEFTAGWEDREVLTDPLVGELSEPKRFETLMKGSDVWAKEVVISRDEFGDADETEVQWFDSLEAAEAAGVPAPDQETAE